MSQHHRLLRLNQAECCSAWSPAVGLRLAGSNLPGLVGQVVGRAAVPLLLTKASENRDWGCWDLSLTPIFPVIDQRTELGLAGIGLADLVGTSCVPPAGHHCGTEQK